MHESSTSIWKLEFLYKHFFFTFDFVLNQFSLVLHFIKLRSQVFFPVEFFSQKLCHDKGQTQFLFFLNNSFSIYGFAATFENTLVIFQTKPNKNTFVAFQTKPFQPNSFQLMLRRLYYFFPVKRWFSLHNDDDVGTFFFVNLEIFNVILFLSL